MVKADFAPNNISKLINKKYKILTIGSTYYFNNISDFDPHDYDYLYLYESDHNEFIKNKSYMYLESYTFYYKKDISKEEYIQFILESANNRHSKIFNLIQKNICDFFKISYNDIEPYIETIKEYVNIIINKYEKYKYKQKILEYIIENKSFELTEHQIQNVYQIYLENRNKNLPNNIIISE